MFRICICFARFDSFDVVCCGRVSPEGGGRGTGWFAAGVFETTAERGSFNFSELRRDSRKLCAASESMSGVASKGASVAAGGGAATPTCLRIRMSMESEGRMVVGGEWLFGVESVGDDREDFGRDVEGEKGGEGGRYSETEGD